ncbi:MAG: hypothetical protein K9N47_26450 [Prosthecobacter sp.]|uniref:hypothetical protein n=1 Tax=Prosthecobacter sp. TaxID=1965333 RepID=UPI002614A255|nr:hypothetical protein [Prosthecobacter sp.]MCF7789693.1 hypothetical protein [Prosthecobacter sp.]
MNHEAPSPAPQTEPAPAQTYVAPPGLDDDLDFSDIELGDRQQDAILGIVCEGGCE